MKKSYNLIKTDSLTCTCVSTAHSSTLNLLIHVVDTVSTRTCTCTLYIQCTMYMYISTLTTSCFIHVHVFSCLSLSLLHTFFYYVVNYTHMNYYTQYVSSTRTCTFFPFLVGLTESRALVWNTCLTACLTSGSVTSCMATMWHAPSSTLRALVKTLTGGGVGTSGG